VHVKVGDLNLSFVPDRVDRLADGTHAVIDYKTGNPSPGHWFGERPEEPQLPLYACFGAHEVAAVAFARLRANECEFKGVAAGDGIAPGIQPFAPAEASRDFQSWDDLFEHWRRVLTKLAGDYRAGIAVVDPRDGTGTCRHCDAGPLCRIHEHARLDADNGEDHA
jgi:hypothetical protein